MRKNTFFGKLFSEIAAILLMIAPCGLYSDGTTVSDSLKDDVTAMITSAKKMPHQIFIVDSSDSMNSFAYSDYVDNCKDAISNIAKGLALCNNAYTQCRNVENNAMCSVDLNCGSITPKCNQIRSTKTKLEQKCNEITNKKYPEPGMFETVSSIDDSRAKKYIGPWDPRRKDYKQDLCFYNWVADSNADGLEGNSAAEAYNREKYCGRHGYSGATCDTKFEQFLQSSGGFIASRSDWDCLTDGSSKITHTNKTSPGTTYYLNRTGGVSDKSNISHSTESCFYISCLENIKTAENEKCVSNSCDKACNCSRSSFWHVRNKIQCLPESPCNYSNNHTWKNRNKRIYKERIKSSAWAHCSLNQREASEYEANEKSFRKSCEHTNQNYRNMKDCD